MFAKTILKPQHIDSYLETDKLAIGVDRKLQQHIAAVRVEIQSFSNQQLKETMPAQEERYLLGLLGASSLFIMSLAGCIFSRRLQGNKN